MASPMDSLGLLVTLILGGLGMFLLVLAVTFLAAKTITKHDFERFNDMEEVLVESEEFLDDTNQHAKDIFIIDDCEPLNSIQESVKKTLFKDVKKEKQSGKSSNFFSSLLRSSRNIFGKRLINVST